MLRQTSNNGNYMMRVVDVFYLPGAYAPEEVSVLPGGSSLCRGSTLSCSPMLSTRRRIYILFDFRKCRIQRALPSPPN